MNTMKHSRYDSLVDLLETRARDAGDELAYGFLGQTGELEMSWTYAELQVRSAGVAAALVDRVRPGDRALLLFAPGLDFLAAFFGCLRAGVIAAPVFPPSPALGPRGLERLAAVAADCDPAIVLSTASMLDRVATLGGEPRDAFSTLARLAIDGLCEAGSSAGERSEGHLPRQGAGDLAFLQYTSGSTSSPRGVRVTHANLLANLASIYEVCGGPDQGPGVSWLPVQHDMGLIEGVLHPLFRRQPGYLMSPATFLARPMTWLEAMSRLGGTNAASPDFGYQLCVRRTTAEERATLDLSAWTMAANGAEPVRADTIERFSEAFADAGFRRETFFPAYGLAENTLLVSSSRRNIEPRLLEADAEGLDVEDRLFGAAGAARTRTLVSCGTPVAEQDLVIADPATSDPLPPGAVGEIWVKGPSAADGYWGREEESERTFRAFLTDGRGPWLRTGDLGALEGGELFVTGRIKDLIILRGRKLYPQDIERTAESAHRLVRPGGAAAVAWRLAPGAAEGIGLVCEVEPCEEPVRLEVERAIRAAVSKDHEAPIARLLFLRPRALPKTTSGKTQRHACAALLRAEHAPEVPAP